MTHKPLHNPDISKNLTKGQWSCREIYIYTRTTVQLQLLLVDHKTQDTVSLHKASPSRLLIRMQTLPSQNQEQ